MSTLRTDLVSWWSLDEESGTRVDSHGSNDLTDVNTVGFGTGKAVNAADLILANNEYLQKLVPSSMSQGHSDFTIALWMNLDAVSGNQGITHNGTVGSIGGDWTDWELAMIGNDLYFYGMGDGTTNSVVWDNLSTGTWYFVVAWLDATANLLKIQLDNGSVQSAASGTLLHKDFDHGFWLGLRSAIQPMGGLLDEVAFWDRMLTSDEITELYNSGAGIAYADTAPDGISRLSDHFNHMNTQTSAPAIAAEIDYGKIAWVNGKRIVGTARVPMVLSIETITVDISVAGSVTTNLTKGQDYTQCVPFLSWRLTTGNNSNGMILHQPQPEMIDNGGTPALKLSYIGDTTQVVDALRCEVTIVEYSGNILVQQGNYGPITAGTTTDITIDSIDTDYSFPMLYGRGIQYSRADHCDAGCKLTTSTNLQVSTGVTASGTDSHAGCWYVITDLTNGSHFSVQHIEYENTWDTWGDFDVTIPTTIALDKTLLIVNATSRVDTTDPNDAGTYAYLLDADTIRFHRDDSTYAGQIATDAMIWHGEVIEFTDSTVVQHSAPINIAAAGSTTTNTTITEVDLDKATVTGIPHYGLNHTTQESSFFFIDLKTAMAFKLTSSTNVLGQMYAMNAADYIEYVFSVIEWDM